MEHLAAAGTLTGICACSAAAPIRIALKDIGSLGCVLSMQICS